MKIHMTAATDAAGVDLEPHGSSVPASTLRRMARRTSMVATTTRVTLPARGVVDGASIYGYEHKIEVPGSYTCRVLLSPVNERLQVLSYDAADAAALRDALLELANLNDYGKVYIKVRGGDRAAFEAAGFAPEARIPRYFLGEEAWCMALYPRCERRARPNTADEERILAEATQGPADSRRRELPPGYSSTLFDAKDAPELAALYGEVFSTYPYPITDPAYLRETARDNVVYRLVRNAAGHVVAAASAETTPALRNAEMTDFASLPSERGKGLAQFLLAALEDDARARFGIECFFTVARASQPGMLKTFHKAGYLYSGALVNNCTIGGGFETMLVFYKP